MFAGIVMFFVRLRLDIIIAVVLAVIEVKCMHGGMVKYPKSVFEEKEGWAVWTKLASCRYWQPFHWNNYKENELMCLDS